MKSYLKNLGAIFAKSFTKEVLYGIVLSFVAIMVTIGAPGHLGLAYQGLESVYYGDTIGKAMLEGKTFESFVANDNVDDALLGQFKFFLFKALTSLITFVVFLYTILIVTETLHWNLFEKKFSMKGFWIRFRVTLVALLLSLPISLIVFIFYLGLKLLSIVSILTWIANVLSYLVIILGVVFVIHMFLKKNLLAQKRAKVKYVLRDFFTFDSKRLLFLVPIYGATFLLVVALSFVGIQINSHWPNTYGLIQVLSFVIPLTWLRQLLYLDWKAQPVKKKK